MNAMTTSHTATVTLPSDTTILITREFAAPKHLVFRTWTEPELIKRWWAGQRGTVDSIDVDLRVVQAVGLHRNPLALDQVHQREARHD